MAVRLFVGNLTYSTTEADLRAYFGTVAPPSQVVLPVDRETGRPRGFAFVEYLDRAHAERRDSEIQRTALQRAPARCQRSTRPRRSRPGRSAAPRRVLVRPQAGWLCATAAGLVRFRRPRGPAAGGTEPQLRARCQAAARRPEVEEEGRGPTPRSRFRRRRPAGRFRSTMWTRRTRHCRISTISPRASRRTISTRTTRPNYESGHLVIGSSGH